MRRHDLVTVRASAWRTQIEARANLAADALVAGWAEEGWPLIARRASPTDAPGVALGLPLPPSAGKRRLSFVVQHDDILSVASPPSLEAVRSVAPRAWRDTLDRLGDVASHHSADACVFGSLAWRMLTGLDYLNDRSDLDFMLRIHRDTDVIALTSDLARIEVAAPMRMDGELIREDDAAAKWKDYLSSAPEILVKTQGGVSLLARREFLAGVVTS